LTIAKGSYHSGKMNPISINIVTALNCEAKPLIDYFRLKKVLGKPFDLYVGDTTFGEDKPVTKINVIVSGIGQIKTAAACGWAASRFGTDRVMWLNVGVAGHRDCEVGKVARVCNVIDPTTSYSHYPALTAKWSGEDDVLMTSGVAMSDYPKGMLVDMEAAAFFQAACAFTNSELVQSLKIVSDNQEVSIERLNASIISDLIQARVNEIVDFMNNLVDLIPKQSLLPQPNDLIAHLHCTVSQRQQYFELVEKLQSLQSFSSEIEQEIAQANSMSNLLSALAKKLDAITPSLAEMV